MEQEEIIEGVKANIEYLPEEAILSVAEFLEGLADSLYDGELLLQIASVMRDVESGNTP